METKTSDRGFRSVCHEPHPACKEKDDRIITESSALGDYEDATPGSSFLWIGFHHHLNREQVRELVGAMNHWLENKRLPNQLTAALEQTYET